MNILYNPSEHRLRALWRLLIQFLVGFLGLGVLLVWAWVRRTRRQASLHTELAEYSVPHEKGEAREKSWSGEYAEKGA